MIKPKKLNKGDKVALVSLSSGLFGDEANKARLDRAMKAAKEKVSDLQDRAKALGKSLTGLKSK